MCVVVVVVIKMAVLYRHVAKKKLKQWNGISIDVVVWIRNKRFDTLFEEIGKYF